MKQKAIIIGAGITGLSAGWKLSEAGWDVTVVEKEPIIGGMAQTFHHKDYSLDLGPHKLFSANPVLMNVVFELVGRENVLIIPKKSMICLQGKFLTYPVSLLQLLRMSPVLCFRCALSYGLTLMGNVARSSPDTSYEEFLAHRFGRALYELTFAPYARKIWDDPRLLHSNLARSRVVIPSLFQMMKQMILGIHKKDQVLSVAEFHYPKGGSGKLPDAMGQKIRDHGGKIIVNAPVQRLDAQNSRVASVIAEGSAISLSPEDVCISTIHPKELLPLIHPGVSRQAMEAANSLKTRRLMLMYLEINKPHLTPDNWLFFPESNFLFNRAFEQKNFDPSMIPPDKTVLCLEITQASTPHFWERTEESIFHEIVDSLVATGLFREDQVTGFFTRILPNGYPVFDLSYLDNLQVVYSDLDHLTNLYTVGRQGSFSYTGMIDSLEIGLLTAHHILAKKGKEEWIKTRKKFESFVVVD